MYPNIRELNVTAGAQGSYSLYGNAAPVFVSACNLSGVIETTGAGDTFCASLLDYLLTHGLEPDPGKLPGNAPLRQHRRLHRHHPQGCHPGHAPGGRGPGAAVTTAQYAKTAEGFIPSGCSAHFFFRCFLTKNTTPAITVIKIAVGPSASPMI